ADPIGIGLIGNEALGAGIVGAGRLALRVEDVEHRAGNPATVTPLLKCKRAAALLLSASLALALGHTLSPIHIGMGDDRCVLTFSIPGKFQIFPELMRSRKKGTKGSIASASSLPPCL